MKEFHKESTKRDSKLEKILPSPRIAVVDYGAGNIKSILNALNRINLENSLLTKNSSDIDAADALILPGVGAFGHCMKNLLNSGLIPSLENAILKKKKPLLGICVGMQLLAESSDEDGFHSGLGWIPGHVKQIKSDLRFRIPHVGWNQVSLVPGDSLFSSIQDGAFFYFDHSYAYVGSNSYITSTASHGNEITASVQLNNIHGVQFHPEKSDRNGLRVFRAFGNMILSC